MKKIYLLTLLMAFVSFSFAQRKVGSILSTHPSLHKDIQIKSLKSSKAVGDTLMYFDSYNVYLANSNDQALFDVTKDDLDQSTVSSTMDGYGFTSEWQLWYEVDTTVVPSDTSFFWGCTSWFATAGQANDWLYMGPVTIPATGAILSWQNQMPDPDYSDGYKVYASTTGMTVSDFSGSPIFTRLDNQAPTAPDTAMNIKSVAVPASMAGQQVYFAFQHDANDMFILYLDEFVVTEANNVGIAEEYVNGIKLNQNQPNPANGNTIVSYEIENASKVSLDIFDITGRLVFSTDEGMQSAGLHNIVLDANKIEKGTYFYSLKADNNRLTKKMIVQ